MSQKISIIRAFSLLCSRITEKAYILETSQREKNSVDRKKMNSFLRLFLEYSNYSCEV